MSFATFGFLFIGIFLNACAQLLLKAGVNTVGRIDLSMPLLATAWKVGTQIPIIAGLSCYVISVVVWIVGLSRVDVSIAYPMLSIGYILNAVGAWYLFGEALGTQRLVGIGIIIVGVYVLARS